MPDTPTTTPEPLTELLAESWPDSPLRRAAARLREKAPGAPDGAILRATAAVLDQVADAWDEDVIWDRPETDEYRPSYPAAWWCGFCLDAVRSADYPNATCTCPRWVHALDLAAEALDEDLTVLAAPYSQPDDDDVPADHREAAGLEDGAA